MREGAGEPPAESLFLFLATREITKFYFYDKRETSYRLWSY